MSYNIHIERTYAYPVERVWQALSDGKAMSDWLMPNNFRAEVGHSFRLTGQPMPGWRGYVECTVVEVDAPHRLVFTWLGDADWTQPTTVSFTLRAEGDHTRLIFDHTGFVDPWGGQASAMLGGGWQGILSKRLAAVMAPQD